MHSRMQKVFGVHVEKEKEVIMQKTIKNWAGVFALPVVLFLFFTIVTSGFGINSIPTVLGQAIIPTVMGFGMAFGMGAGIFDLSTGSRVIVAASVGGYFAQIYGLPGLIIGSLVAGIVASIVMGFAYNILKIPSLVLSLGFVMLLEVLSYAFLGKTSFIQISGNLTVLGRRPQIYIICLVLAVIFYLLYYRTGFAYHIRAVGNNETLAKNMGINASRVYFMTFAVGGIFIGIVGALYISYYSSISAVMDMGSLNMVFSPMMGVLVGTELLLLVDNLALNIIIGEVCLTIIFNGLIAMGVPTTMQDVMLGIFMVAVIGFSANREKIGKLMHRKREVSA